MPGPDRRTLRAPIACLALLGFLAPPIAAQGEPVAPALLRIHTGAEVRVTMQDGTRFQGRFDRVGGGRLGISLPDRGIESVPAERLRLVEIRSTHAGTGAIVGGVAGVLAGAFVATIARAVCESADCDGVGPYLVAVPLFGGTGALLGTAVGAFIPRWRRTFP